MKSVQKLKCLRNKKEADFTTLISLIEEANTYIDTAKYEYEYVNKLQIASNNAALLTYETDVTQEEIDEQLRLLQEALTELKRHPLKDKDDKD